MTDKKKNISGILMALAAAVFYAIGIPLSKVLLVSVPATLMAGFLYFGAGLCMCAVLLIRTVRKSVHRESKLRRKDLPYTLGMIVLDIAAPICLMFGLSGTSAATASLLNNFEIVATAVIALAVFKEYISPRLWVAIGFVTVSCMILSGSDITSFRFTASSWLIISAAVLWGVENNCTRKISSADPMQIVMLKGIFSGCGSLTVGFLKGERIADYGSVPAVLSIGAVSYGMSIFLYIYAQRYLGAARTGAYYAVSPFVGTMISLVLFREKPTLAFLIGFVLMAVGAFLASSDKPLLHKAK